MKKLILSALVLGGAMTFTAQAQNKAAEPAEEFFLEGRAMFIRQNYVGALDQFRLYRLHGGQEHALEVDYYSIIADYLLGADHDYVLGAVGNFLDNFPESIDKSRVRLLTGELMIRHEQYLRANTIFSDIDDRTLNDEDLAAYLLYYAYVRMQLSESNALAEQMLLKASESRGELGGRARLLLAAIQIEDGRIDEAEQTLSRLKNHPQFADEADAYIAEIQLLRGDYREAAEIADGLLSRNSSMRQRPQLLRVAGNAYYRLGDSNKTIDYLSDYSEKVGDRIAPTDAYALGVTYYKQGLMKEALRPLAAATTDAGSLGAESALYLGQAQLDEGMTSEALMAFEKAATQDVNRPVREVGMYNMAMLMRSTGQSSFGQSVRIAENFLNEFPRSSHREQMAAILVESYFTGKDYNSSLRSIQKIAQPTASILAAKQFVLNRMAEQKEAAGYDSEALSFVSSSISMGNKGEYFPEAYFLRGNLRYRAGDFPAAAADYRVYISAAGDRDAANLPLGYYRLGYSLFNAERYDMALEAFKEYVSRSGIAPNLSADAYARIGDCRYMKRDFHGAREAYSMAYRVYPSGGDYALLRRARLEGLAKQYADQIQTLDKLIREFPDSRHLTAALYEKGCGAVLSGKHNVAEEAFNAVVKRSPDSREARQSSLQLGLLYYNTGRTKEAIRTYQRIIDRYPRSEETTVALSDLRSIYLEEDRIDEYSAYVRGLKDKVSIAPSETEQLGFLSAERKYRRRQPDARRDLEAYLERYPQGSDRHKAELYLADLDYQAGNADAAYNRYSRLVNSPGLPEDYKIDARLRLGRMQYERKEYKAALQSFQSVLDTDGAEAVRDQAVQGVTESAYADKDYRRVIDVIAGLKNQAALPHTLRLYRAKSYQALKMNREAIADYELLAEDFSTATGAEAVVMQAQLEMEAKRLSKAKSILEKFIAKSTPQQYWLARGFILLSDIYKKEGDTFTARQYLESLEKNYPNHEDDIHEQIAQRLE